MTCKRSYQCDLCNSSMPTHSDGIGIRWDCGNKITAVYFANSEHHLCNSCVAGLREMFADLDKTSAMFRELDAVQ